MPTKKINWIEAKQNYIQSEIIEVREFLISFLSVDPKNASNGSYAKATKGWRSEKEAYISEINKKITEKVILESLNNADLSVSQETLLKIKKLAINSIGKRIQDNTAKLTMNELVNALNAIKTELGETTSVSTLNSNVTSVINSNRYRPENEK